MIASGIQKINIYESDSLVPIAKVTYSDSPYGVPSLGYCVEYYDNPGGILEFTFDEPDLVLRGHDNILSYDWSFGVPAGVPNIYFKAKYYGYFYAKFTGDYRFLVSTDPSNKVRFYMDAVTPDHINASGVFDHAGYFRIENLTEHGAAWSPGDIESNETWYQTINLSGGTWYAWGLQFINGQENATLALRYIEPASVSGVDDNYPSDHDPFYRSGHSGLWGWIDSDAPTCHDKKVCHQKIMSAGITNYHPEWADDSDAYFEPAKEIKSVIKIQGSHDADKSSVFSFSVPINNSALTDSGAYGFVLNRNTGLYYEQASNVSLQHGRKVSIYLGYESKCNYANGASCDHSNPHITGYYSIVCESGGNIKCPGNCPLDTDYVKCFEGIITDISPSLSKTDYILDISCQDQMLFMLNAINENYPNNISYAVFDYISDRKPRQPNGLTRPAAYDGWSLSSMIRDLCVKSGIDPTWLYGRKQIITAGGSIDYGSYLIDDHDLILKRKSKYGNPLSTDDETSDDEYIWAYNFGDTLHSMASKAIDMYGYMFRITSDGYVQCNPINSPALHIPDWTYTATHEIVHNTWNINGEWSAKVDSRADGGRYYECSTPSSPLIKTVKGSKFDIGIIREIPGDTTVIPWYNIYAHQNLSESPNTKVGLYDYIVSGSGDPITGISVHETLRDSMHVFDVNKTFKLQNMYMRLKSLEGVNTQQDGVGHPGKHNSITVKWSFYSIPDPSCLSTSTAEELFENSSSDLLLIETGDLSLLVAPYNYIENYVINIPLSSVILTSGVYYAIKFEQEDGDLSIGPSIDGQIWDCLSPINAQQQDITYSTIPTIISRETKYIDGNLDTQTYTKTRFSVPIYLDIYFDTVVEFDGVHSTCRVDIFRESTGEYVTTISESNTYDGHNIHSDNLRFPEDGNDFTGLNPCLINVPSALLQSGTYNGIPLMYDTYRFEIVHSGDYGIVPTRITSIRGYEDDIYAPIYHFDTWRNIQKLDAEFTMDDIRNDVVVIGSLKGKVESIDGNIINRNNPIYDYVYSRSTDVGSIYLHNAKNSTGRKSSFVVFDGTVSEQRHADWLSMAILKKYNVSHNVPTWSAIGYTFIEPYDTIYIKDLSSNIMRDDEMQWVVSCSHNFENGRYVATYKSTPYEPWASYTPRPTINMEDFLDSQGNAQPFVNIKMTTTRDDYCGYNLSGYSRFDVYEVEESGNRLKIVYDQVIDGFVNIKIYKVGVSNPIAWLVGYVDENGFQKDEYRERGYNYELFWDCTDETAASKLNYTIASGEAWKYIDNFKTEQGLYATSGDYYVVFELSPIEQNEGLDEEIDRYHVNTEKLPYNLNSDGFTLISGSGSPLTYSQYWSIKWGDVPIADMSVQRPLEDGSWQDCTYHYNSINGDYGLMFGPNNDPAGMKIKFDFSNTSPRLVYFKVNSQIIRGTAIQSPKLKPDLYEYVKSMWHSYWLTKGNPRSAIYPDYLNNTVPAWGDYNDFITFFDAWTRWFGIYYRYYNPDIETLDLENPFCKLHHNSLGNRQLAVPYYSTLRSLSIDSVYEENKNALSCFDRHAKFDDGNKTVTFWSQDIMPYENIEVEDYIKPFAKKVTSAAPITISHNPGRIVQNQVDFAKIPIMEKARQDAFRQTLATMIWIATLNKKNVELIFPQHTYYWNWDREYTIHDNEDKPQILVANYVQPTIFVWDKTGRYISSNNLVFNGELSHIHNKLSNCINEGLHYTSVLSNTVGQNIYYNTHYLLDFSTDVKCSNLGLEYLTAHTHSGMIEKCWLPSRQFANFTSYSSERADYYSSNTQDRVIDIQYWAGENYGYSRYIDTRPLFLQLKNYKMYDMTTNSNYNWGIGLVNSDTFGSKAGCYTWHGYLYLKNGMAGQQFTNIPFDTTNIPNTRHWCAFMSDNENWIGKNITHTRIAMAVEPSNINYTQTNAYDDFIQMMVKNCYGLGIIDEYVHVEGIIAKYNETSYSPENFHIHFPVPETMPYDDMKLFMYMYPDDSKNILNNELHMNNNKYWPGETDGDWSIVVNTISRNIIYIGTVPRFTGDDEYNYTTRNCLGITKPKPMNHSPHYKNKPTTSNVGGYHYAWFNNPDIQIPDWDIPADLSTWTEIPNVMNFGITWGL